MESKGRVVGVGAEMLEWISEGKLLDAESY